MEQKSLTFEQLISYIQQVHEQLAAQASKAVNISLTLRNWVIGHYIYEYEQNGADRAQYGAELINLLADRLKKQQLSRVDSRELRRYRHFYITYPQIRDALSPKFKILRSKVIDGESLIPGSPISKKRETASPKLTNTGTDLVKKLSFSHFVELLTCEDDAKRAFYEIECMRGNWSVRELKRQINSLYYERSGLSKDKNKLAKLVKSVAETAEPKLPIRDPYIFEFLGLKPREVMGESDLEDSLLDKLQDFLLELGRGFCFESRQKRILIGDEYFFIDLVFYHRILKCHVLIELKVDEFKHEYLGQLNTYVSWYKDNEISKDDNSPIGILLCTRKNHALVEYALAGIDNQLFVSKYQLELPKKEDIQKFLEAQLRQECSKDEQ